MTLGLGGFQETEQLPIFSKITKYQAHVNNKARMAELTGRAFDRALLEMGPAQLNIPRDFFYGDIESEIPRPLAIERGAGGEKSLDEAAELLAGGAVSGDPRGRRHRDGRRAGRRDRARRAAACAGGMQLPAQRRVPGEAPLVVRTAGLPGLEGRDEADRESRRRAGARHAARPVRHAAAARPRLLAEERENRAGRRRREDARTREADLRRHLRRCRCRGARTDRAA